MGIASTIPEAGLNYVLYGDKSQMVGDYLARQMQIMGPSSNPIMNRMYDALAASYNYVTNSLVKTGIMQQLRQKGVAVVDNYFEELKTEEQFRRANPTMQRYVMAHPDLRQLYIQQNLDGYSDTYQNVFGNEVGSTDYNYRRVMSGAVVDTDTESVLTIYDDDLYIGDKELSTDEKFLIRSTWSNIDLLLATTKVDFTHQTDPSATINRE